MASNRSALQGYSEEPHPADRPGGRTTDDEKLKQLQDDEAIALRYSTNLNGSSIAGAASRDGNVLGLMPHPERACDRPPVALTRACCRRC